MTQTYTDNCFQSGNVGQTDLQNIENNFAALKSNFSGVSTPANSVAGMLWFDSNADTNNKGVQKLRNNDGDWFGLLHGDSTHILLVYRNTAIDGWAIDSTVTDKVVAIKGGSTYTTGGAIAGSWSISGVSTNSDSHNHKWYNYTNSSDPDTTYDTSGSSVDVTMESAKLGGSGDEHVVVYDNVTGYSLGDAWTNNDSHSHTASGDGTWRIRAAVHTHQYIDI